MYYTLERAVRVNGFGPLLDPATLSNGTNRRCDVFSEDVKALHECFCTQSDCDP